MKAQAPPAGTWKKKQRLPRTEASRMPWPRLPQAAACRASQTVCALLPEISLFAKINSSMISSSSKLYASSPVSSMYTARSTRVASTNWYAKAYEYGFGRFCSPNLMRASIDSRNIEHHFCTPSLALRGYRSSSCQMVHGVLGKSVSQIHLASATRPGYLSRVGFGAPPQNDLSDGISLPVRGFRGRAGGRWKRRGAKARAEAAGESSVISS